MNLTKRHNDILRAALSYAYSNVDDINDAMSDLHLPVAPFTGEEIEDLQKMLGFDSGNNVIFTVAKNERFDFVRERMSAPTQDEADAIVRDMIADEQRRPY